MKYIIEICVAIDIAILGIAYPILIDKISNIGQKYNSEYLPNVFESEYPDKKIIGRISILQLILIFTLISFIFQIFSFAPIKCFEANILIENSSDILVFIFTVFLTITFFYWVNKIMLYQGKASELLKYLIIKHNNNESDDQSKTYLLKTINEFSLYAIEKQDIHLQESLLDFYFKQFQEYRNKELEYPFDLYNITYEIIQTGINNSNTKLKALEHRASSGMWLIGESFQFSKIHPTTYKWLWRNLVLSSSYNKLISNYWSSSSQYFNYSLKNIMPEYNENGIKNIDEINKVEKERKKFLEINYALGGLLYYKSNYQSIKYILSFSQSQPPSYPLLPQTMDDIFSWFNHFSNEYKTLDEPIDYKFYFPELDNLGTSKNISHNICLYIAILFVRQFTQNTIYVYQNFKKFHNLTDELQELYSFNDRLPYFKNCITTILENESLLEILNYKIEKDEVLDIFEELSNKIKEKIDFTKLNAPISTEKVIQFEDVSADIISKAFDQYKIIQNEENFENFDEKMISSINGELILSSKSSFSENDIPHLNFDSVYAQHIANNKIKYYLPNSFLIARTEKYLIERQQLLEGLEKIISDVENIIIIGIRINYETRELINNSKFKSQIIEIYSTNNYLTDTFFILNKSDLPKFESKEPLAKEIKKFNLKEVNTEYKIFTNVIDINLPENKNLKDEYITSDDEELKVLLLISFIFLIKWKKNRQVVMLSLTSPFQERGIANKIEDLKQIAASR